jgi:signal transduction histidine kinase
VTSTEPPAATGAAPAGDPVWATPPAPPAPAAPAAAPISTAETGPVQTVPAPPRPRPGLVTAARSWAWGWLAITQLLLDLTLAGPYLVVGGLLLGGLAAVAGLVGVLIVVVALAAARVIGPFERARLRAFTGLVVLAPLNAQAGQPWWRRVLLDTRPWRASVHLTLIAFWGLAAGATMLGLLSVAVALAALPAYDSLLPDGGALLPGGAHLDPSLNGALAVAGGLGLLVLPLVARGLVGVDMALGRWLLGPSGNEQVRQLSARVVTLTETREATVDSVEAERRRIERDLHDGPQQRMVSIAMDLGMARQKLDRDPAGASELIDKAHAAAKEAITEMRQVARGIHPPVLTDRGLDAALSALAARAPVPVTVAVELDRRPTPTVEAIAYFCVSEALTNVAKHAQATTARVHVFRSDGALVVTITDDGTGGADPERGTGLHGLRQRVRSVDGTLELSSPVGGPTVLTVTLPERQPQPADDSPWRTS